MKRSYKFLILFLTLTAFFSVISAFITSAELDAVRNNTNRVIMQIAREVKEKYPEIGDDEIASILNGTSGGKEVENSLEKYGIEIENMWAVYDNEGLSKNVIILNTFMCAAVCLVLCAVFVLYCLKRKKETCQITEYVAQIKKKNYDLAIDENSEDEMSLLKNEIYKTTVMLKEQSDNSLKDKENLKESLSDISHQLKTPLTSIMIMLDNIIEDENMPPQIRTEFLNDIRRSTNSISFLVQSILTLSKLDANSIVFKNKNEKISEIIDECIRNTAVLAELKGVIVTCGCERQLELECDFKWLCEAITNIVKNCIEHTDNGGSVKISASGNKLYTKITIADNGCGISKKDLPHIFERFYKGENSNGDSVGIGLALAKTIVEKSGGILSANSEEGKGSVFEIKYFIS